MTQKKLQELLRSVLESQMTIVGAMHLHMIPAWLQKDLSMGQVRTLFILKRNGPVSVSEVAERLGIGRPSASVLVDALVVDGLLLREEDPADRRRAILTLSPEGRRLVTEAWQGGHEILEKWLAMLDPNDLEGIRSGLEKLSAVALEEHNAHIDAISRHEFIHPPTRNIDLKAPSHQNARQRESSENDAPPKAKRPRRARALSI
jgi:DNA-binding MarR family transcriptional regulator